MEPGNNERIILGKKRENKEAGGEGDGVLTGNHNP